MKHILVLCLAGTLAACNSNSQVKQIPKATDSSSKYPSIGTIERIDPALDAIVSPTARAEIIAQGYDWSEGPLWVEKSKMLLFSDVPKNTIYKWTEEKGAELYLTPSGYTDTIKRGGETGSNGLALDNNGNLILCQHGNRQIARMNAPLDAPKPEFITVADRFNGRRFSSPNDAVVSSTGEVYFTDPPYGLEKQANDPKKETSWNGVYKVKANGDVLLLVDSISRPNGIAFFPGQKRLLVASSDGAKPNWYVYDIDGDKLVNGKIFYSAANRDRTWKGLPDGFKIDNNGNVFASGPGGIYIFNSEAKLLGRLRVPESISNVAMSADQKTLYITNDMNIIRFKMRD